MNSARNRASRHVLEARREQVAALVLGRRSMREIAAALKVGPTTVHRDISALRKEWRARSAQDTDAAMAELLARLDAVERVLWPMVMRGDLQAADRWLKLTDRVMALLGLNREPTVDWEVEIRRAALEAGEDPDEAVKEAQAVLRGFEGRKGRGGLTLVSGG